MINSTYIKPGFRFSAYNVIYEVKEVYSTSTSLVNLYNTKTEVMFLYEIKDIVNNINKGAYHVESRATLNLTYIEEL